MSESVLVNFVYAHPVGHAIEALQYCLGYHLADPERRIGLVLNEATPAELARWCPFVHNLYTTRMDMFAPDPRALEGVPRDWDWVVDDPRGWQDVQRAVFPGLAAYYDLARAHFRARAGHHEVGAGGPDYLAGHRLRLTPPREARAAAETLLPATAGPRIAVLPGGSADRSLYPSVASWRRILRALAARFPDATFCLTGKLADDGRTRTTYSRAELDELRAAVPRCVLALDLPIAEQLAVVDRCDALVSPHSGFGMAALAVGTPWVVLGGNKWPEFYFNPGVPFYSVLPDVERFPCYTAFGPDPEPVEDDGPRSPSMSAARIESDVDELVEATARIVEGRWDYETAMTDHFRRLTALYDGHTEWMYSVDGVHLPYLPG
ncbi:glycosyltransferase family 9 protein [Amycolatopsis anabasis]|uniref:glycosyltransferase family 9 protein n=1 Tax=Amycolatopsis anabasis TaxID=1840409 RepID=UPI00131BCD26|nr:hypothetical protein [Amycolatopsis anabasis]